jgi:4-carboxymuconolactone decarboxylase
MEKVMGSNRQKALTVIKQMFPATAEQLENPTRSAFAPEMNDLAMTICFEPLWTRDGIDLRTRSLINVALLIAQRAHSELEFHAPAAIRNGATVAELEEVLYQAAGYAGFPAAASAHRVMGEALRKAGMIA